MSNPTTILQARNSALTASESRYAPVVELDFVGDGVKTLALAGNARFTTMNRQSGRSVTVRILGDHATRTLAFPAWTFIGASAPGALAAGKVAILTVQAFGREETDVVAAYAVQP